jgi:hypothetical protein
MPMAPVGITRAFGIDFRRYLSDRGVKIYNEMQNASIIDVLGLRYTGLKWKDMAKPEYPTPESIPLHILPTLSATDSPNGFETNDGTRAWTHPLHPRVPLQRVQGRRT